MEETSKAGQQVMQWLAVVVLVIGGGGLSGCAAGLDSVPSLDAAFEPPSLSSSLGLADERLIHNDPASEAPAFVQPPAEERGADSEAPAVAQPDIQPVAAGTPLEPAADAPSPTLAEPPEAALMVAQATPDKAVEAAKDEYYDPFATAEGSAQGVEEYDPWEPFNVRMFQFNRKLDEWIVRPVAKVYDKVIPDQLEHGISNAFHNIRSVPRILNNLFQGKFKGAGIETARLVLNSTFGVAGFMDFAKENYDLVTPDEDFGQTLAVHGTKPGPYLVIPILGSFTLRDGAGYVVDLFIDPFNLLLFPFFTVNSWPQVVTNEDTVTFSQISIRAGYMVNERALNIETTFEGVEETVVDLYGAVRNAYLQKRARAIRE